MPGSGICRDVACSGMWHFPGCDSLLKLASPSIWQSPACGFSHDWTIPRICAGRRWKRSGKGHFPGSGCRRDMAFAATEGGSMMWQFPGCGIVRDVAFPGYGIFLDLTVSGMWHCPGSCPSWIGHVPGSDSFWDVAFPGMWQFPARGLPRDLARAATEEIRRRRRQIQTEAKSRRKLNPGGAKGTFCMWAKGPECARAARRVVSNTLVEGAPGATNLTRPALVPSPLHFHTPAH